MANLIEPYFTTLCEFASAGSGGEVAFATDDFFAPCEGMLRDAEPVFVPDKYTECGKWMDGWESRRRRAPGHDWCVLRLATKCVVRGVMIDTAHFTGNHVPRYSILAACLTPEEEALMPKRDSQMGTACSESDLQDMKRLNSDEWQEIVPRTLLLPGYEETRRNYREVKIQRPFTHIRLNTYPDGGIARFRVYGVAHPETDEIPINDYVNLFCMKYGTVCVGYSNAHFGHPQNMTKPKAAAGMADGWETARRLDRPAVIELNGDGTVKTKGKEWSVFKLGIAGTVERICVDTAHFKGNYADSVKIEGTFLEHEIWTPHTKVEWTPIMGPCKLSAHKEHWFEARSCVVNHIRVTMAPDGGISRIRLLGHRTPL